MAMTQPLTQTSTAASRWKSPRLRVASEEEESNHASWIELFFDLVFVVVIAELSHMLEQHLSWIGFLQFTASFVPCWWVWVLVTFYVDRYNTDDPPHRLLILTGMLAVIFLAANVHNAFDTGAVGFVLAYVTIRTIVLGLYFRATRYVQAARPNLKLYLASYIPSTSLWLGSLAFPDPTRYWLWGAAMGPLWGRYNDRTFGADFGNAHPRGYSCAPLSSVRTIWLIHADCVGRIDRLRL